MRNARPTIGPELGEAQLGIRIKTRLSQTLMGVRYGSPRIVTSERTYQGLRIDASPSNRVPQWREPDMVECSEDVVLPTSRGPSQPLDKSMLFDSFRWSRI